MKLIIDSLTKADAEAIALNLCGCIAREKNDDYIIMVPRNLTECQNNDSILITGLTDSQVSQLARFLLESQYKEDFADHFDGNPPIFSTISYSGERQTVIVNCIQEDK